MKRKSFDLIWKFLLDHCPPEPDDDHCDTGGSCKECWENCFKTIGDEVEQSDV